MLIKFFNSFTKRQGLFQALGVTLYCALIGIFFWKANSIFGNPGILAPIIMLILLSVSVLICALLVFYKPYRLFFADKKKDAVNLVLSTTAWPFLFLVISLALALTLKH